ncbi:hypothetical protein [Pseudomonas sp. EA_105y_Pfl2_R69]|uniref:hypothetical protein n=1 Tax=Pseudomonas sp. EA_105y_Pfl2_R69 TaxID=3088683 RepID=UPI0030DA9703
MSEACRLGADAIKKQIFPLKATVAWYVLGSVAVLWLLAVGESPRNKSHFEILAAGGWLELGNIIVACLFAIIIPLPHVLISLTAKKMRNRFSVSRIYRGWYMVLVTFVVLGALAAGVNSTALAVSSKMEYEFPQASR